VIVEASHEHVEERADDGWRSYVIHFEVMLGIYCKAYVFERKAYNARETEFTWCHGSDGLMETVEYIHFHYVVKYDRWK